MPDDQEHEHARYSQSVPEAELAHKMLGQQADNAVAQGNLRARLIQEEIDRRFSALQAQIDQLLVMSKERSAGMQLQLDQRVTGIHGEMDQRLAMIQRELDQRFLAEAKARETSLITATEAVRAALLAAETAVGKAEVATEKRFDSMNEFRQTLSDQAGSFPTRTEVNAKLTTVDAIVTRNAETIKDVELRITSRLDTLVGEQGGMANFRREHRLDIGQLISLIVMVLIAAGLVVSVIAHK